MGTEIGVPMNTYGETIYFKVKSLIIAIKANYDYTSEYQERINH